jgi:hypothetical protein
MRLLSDRRRRIASGLVAAGLLATQVGVTRVLGADPDGGVVEAQVSVPASGGACLELSTTSVSFGSLLFGVVDQPADDPIRVTNCADAGARILARGTDATGPGVHWWLDGTIATCDGSPSLPPNHYRLTVASPAAGVRQLAIGNRDIQGLAAGASVDQTLGISTACPGSSGASTTLTMEITFTATQGEELPVGAELLSETRATAEAAASALIGGTRELPIPSASAPSTVTMTGSTLGLTAVPPRRWDVTAQLVMQSTIPMPFELSGASCLISIDTTALGTPAVGVAFSLTFEGGDAATVATSIAVGDMALTNFDLDDYTVSGDFLCSLGLIPVSLVRDGLEDAIRSQFGPRLCGDPEGDGFVPCPSIP